MRIGVSSTKKCLFQWNDTKCQKKFENMNQIGSLTYKNVHWNKLVVLGNVVKKVQCESCFKSSGNVHSENVLSSDSSCDKQQKV